MLLVDTAIQCRLCILSSVSSADCLDLSPSSVLKQAAADARLPDPVATISALNRFTPELLRHENRNIKNYIQYRILMNHTDSANSSTFFALAISCSLKQQTC